MLYPWFEKKCRRIICLLYMTVLFTTLQANAQVKWYGKAGDGQWTTPANWVGNAVPAITDDVYLDNSVVNDSYTVYLPAGTNAITVKSVSIAPSFGNKIQLVLPATNTAAPAFTATGPGYGISIDKDGALLNASGSAAGAAIVVNDSFRINNSGAYIHNTRSAHAALVTVLSRLPGTEKGIFKFDVPGGGYTFASTSRTYGTLQLSADASGGSQSYASSAANPFTINGDFILQPGVTVNLDITAVTTIMGNYIQEGGVFNLASQPNNNTVFVKGDFMQTGGSITETAAGLPAIELNGGSQQQIQSAGTIVNSVDFRINNPAGVSLASGLSLPYKFSLINGIVNTHAFLITLLAGCSIQADSLSNNSFVNGALRKEGLVAAAHFLFPVGKDITQRWLALKNANGNYTVEFIKVNPNTLATAVGTGIHHVSSIEYWLVQADATPAPNSKIELSFDNVNSGGVTDMAALKVAQLNAGTWTDAGNTATTGSAGSAGSVVSNPVNMFGAGNTYFSLASSDAFQNPLPIKMISFNAQAQGNAVAINWRIAGDWQPVGFELQSAEDGHPFSTIAVIPAAALQTFYQYTDKRKLVGSINYRVRTTEKDGSFLYARDLRVIATASPVGVLRLWPSIVKSNARLFMNAVAAGALQVEVYDMNGKLLQTKAVFVQAGSNTIPLQLHALAAGMYMVAVKTADSKVSSTRFVKQP